MSKITFELPEGLEVIKFECQLKKSSGGSSQRKKVPAQDANVSSTAIIAGSQGNVQEKAKRPPSVSDNEELAEFGTLALEAEYNMRDEFSLLKSDGMYRKVGGEKTYYLTEVFVDKHYTDKKTRNRIVKLAKDKKWIISGPDQVSVYGVSFPMYQIDLAAIKKAVK